MRRLQLRANSGGVLEVSGFSDLSGIRIEMKEYGEYGDSIYLDPEEATVLMAVIACQSGIGFLQPPGVKEWIATFIRQGKITEV
jgi:hypothetical protein